MFTAAKQTRTFEAILIQFREAIIGGRLAAGDRLPSQRDLAEQFGVSRATVLQALHILERSGLIAIRPGARGGAFVRTPDDQPLSDHLDLLLELEQVSIVELLEFRQVLEGQNAFWAAERATDDEIAAIGEIVAIVAAVQGDTSAAAWRRQLDADPLFHDAVANAAHNRAMSAVMRGVLAVLARELEKVPQSSAPQGYADLRGIYDAIAARDSVLAQDRMRSHIAKFFLLSNRATDSRREHSRKERET